MPIELSEQDEQSSSFRDSRLAKAVATVLAACFLVLIYLVSPLSNHKVDEPIPQRCVQPPVLSPDFDDLKLQSSSYFTTDEYFNHSVSLLQGAIRIPTISYDDMSFNVTGDDRFAVFHELHQYLFNKFPLLASKAETVNTYGLLYTIEGRDASLKPLVLAAHQDVVPVTPESLDQWDHKPFDAVFDGTWLYGRGSCDTKNSLVAIHEAVEHLLRQNWVPERTVLLSFGFDEEIQGWRGARKLSEVIEERYGKIEMLIDEGFGVEEHFGALFAMPCVSEKGRVNFRATLFTKGGHSSQPPDHTGIGVMADLITDLERDIPLEPEMTDVIKQKFTCIGELAPNKDDQPDHKHGKHNKHKKSKKGKHGKHWKHGKHGKHGKHDDKHDEHDEHEHNDHEQADLGKHEIAKRGEQTVIDESTIPVGLRYLYTHLNSPGKQGLQAVNELTGRLSDEISTRVMVETTQAIDIIHGGVKINALPEQVVMEVNYRINPASSVERETKRFMEIAKENAYRFGLSLNYSNPFLGQTEQEVVVPTPNHLGEHQSGGFMHIETTDLLDVAPVSSYSANSTHWQLISGTVRHVFGDVMHEQFNDLPVFASPGLMTGNTDTAHYWNVTHNLYRFNSALNSDMQNVHTVNEALRPRSHISTVAFVYELLANLPVLN